jgi:cobalamin biosynthesis protein CobT
MLRSEAPDIYAHFIWFNPPEDEEDDEDGEEEDDEDDDSEEEEEEEEDEIDKELNMKNLGSHSMVALRAFAKKHNIRIFGRSKDDAVRAIHQWNHKRKVKAPSDF